MTDADASAAAPTADTPPALDLVTTFELVPTPSVDAGTGPLGKRRIGFVKQGSFDGPLLSGTVIGGDDHYLVRADKALDLDVRLVLRTNDGAFIRLTWRALVSGPKEVMRALGGDPAPDPESYYFRAAAFMETGDERYDWTNRAVFVGAGQVGLVSSGETGVVYRLYRVL